MLQRNKNKIISRISAESGQVLIFALILFALVSIMIGPLLNMMSSGLKQGTVVENRTNQLFIADAGIESACQNILKGDLGGIGEGDPPYVYTINDINEVNSRVEVSIARDPDTSAGQNYAVVSAGADSTGAITTITATVLASQGGGSFENALAAVGGNIVMSGATSIDSDGGEGVNVFSSGNLTLSGSSNITGDVYAQGNVTLDSSTTIDGNAEASGSVGSSGTIAGTRTSNAPIKSPPLISDQDLNNMVQNTYDETYSVGTITPQGTSVSSMLVKNQGSSSSYYHYANPVYVTGDLTFSNVNYVVFDSQVYVGGNINFSGGTQNVIFNGPVYAGGQLSSSGGLNITFNYTFITGSMNLGGSGTFTFNGSVKDLGILTVGNSVNTTFGGTIYTGGNFSYGGASNFDINANIYIKGTLTLTNSAQIVGPEKVVVRSNVSISGAGSFTNTNQLPFIIVPPGSTTPGLSPSTDPATVTVTNSGYASAVVYAPTALLTISGAGSLYGAVIAESATLGNSARIVYPGDLGTRTDLSPGVSEISIKTWKVN